MKRISLKRTIIAVLLIASMVMPSICTLASDTVTMYAADGRTKYVFYKDLVAYKNVGWYILPPVTMYAADGRTRLVDGAEVEAYKNVGWFVSPPITMYAPDGRTALVAGTDVAAWKNVGWYDYKVITVYDSSGNGKVIATNSLSTYKSKGWHEGTETIGLYSADGRTKYVFYKDLAEYLKVGWYTEPVSNYQKEDSAEQITQLLNKYSSLAKEYAKKSDEIIKKYNLNIYGHYVTTKTATLGMFINEDNTINFSDGKRGWWLVEESKEGAIHLGITKEGTESVELLLICDNGYMVDVGKALFLGRTPSETTFEQTFTDTSGDMVFQFKKDGTIEAEYTMIMEEDGRKFPWTEAYRGEYKKTGEYLDIVLNGSHACYLVFTAQTADPEKPITGFASKYYTKQVVKD